ncbi:MAG: glycosyltransferase family 2 protein [Thalassobaculales bacterium]
MTAHQPEAQEGAAPLLSVVVPVRNEAENIAPLVAEIRAALAGVAPFEIIYVDDGSTDDTPARLSQAMAQAPELRVLRHDRSCGQSAAVLTGVRAARGRLIGTLDGDGQNDPADLPAMLARWRQAPVAMIAGQRVRRQDTLAKRLASRAAFRLRALALGDATPDTGCGIKLFERAAFLDLPYFDHIHRFLPALMRREGHEVALQPVNHRARQRGRSNYGVLDRALVGLVDLIGVMWLLRRRRLPKVSPVERSAAGE